MLIQYKDEETKLNEAKHAEKCIIIIAESTDFIIETYSKDGHLKSIIVKEKSYD